MRATMTKTELLQRLNLNQEQLAERFEISPSAVSQWPADEPLPRLRLLELPERFPELFRRSRRAAKKAAA